MRYSASATQRPSSPTGTPFGSGGLLSHENSVTQKRTGCVDAMRPRRTPASRTAFISGRSPIETSSLRYAWLVGPPAEYGSVDQMSKCTFPGQVACGLRPDERQRTLRMNASGATAVEMPKGARPPAMTAFPLTVCALCANALMSSRYQGPAPGLNSGPGTLF